MNDLVGLAQVCTENADRVLQGNPRNGRLPQQANKRQGCGLFSLFVPKPSSTGRGQVSTGWMSDHQIPIEMKQIPNVSLMVRAGTLGRQQITANSLVTASDESVPHDSTKLTGY